MIEFDIDDQSPEELATGLDRLRRVAGVRDVATFSGIGKKGRWLQAVRVMADPVHRDAVVGAVGGSVAGAATDASVPAGLRSTVSRRARAS